MTVHDADDCADVGLDCREAMEKLERFLDGELPSETVESITAHLSACYPCAGRREFESRLRIVIRERCTERAPEDLVARIRQRLGFEHTGA